MIDYSVEPWEIWPRKETPASARKAAPFHSTYENTQALLHRELLHLKADMVVVQANVKRDAIRLDGRLRSDAVLRHPGIILSFRRKRVHAVQMACDACRDWRDNVRAIALTLERLRLADLYGVTQSGEQYRGFQALPPPGAQPIREMTKEQAADLIAKWSAIPQDVMLADAHVLKAAIRIARVKAHPDKGGSAADAAEVSVAAELLETLGVIEREGA